MIQWLLKERKRILWICCLCVVSVLYCGMHPGSDLTVLARTKELPVYSVERDDQVIAISFDAAWGGAQTMALLDILDEYDVKTTFFLVGIWVEKYPELVQEMVKRGHEIGNHSTTHPQMSTRAGRKSAGSSAQSATGLRN